MLSTRLAVMIAVVSAAALTSGGGRTSNPPVGRALTRETARVPRGPANPRDAEDRAARTGFRMQPADGEATEAAEYALPMFVSMNADTYVIAEFDFDGPSGPDPSGWITVDRTADSMGTIWHVNDFLVPSAGGSRAMWCGVRPESSGPFCSYQCLPGYGNDWDQVLETPNALPALGDVIFSFDANWDTEAGYDEIKILYYHKSGYWSALATLDGVAVNQHRSYVVPAANLSGSVKLRVRFSSDEVWSDEDCLYDTDGAIQIDNLMIQDATGTLHFEDFEDEPLGATVTSDGVWRASEFDRPAFGDYAGLFYGTEIVQEDACLTNDTYFWAFIEGSTDFCNSWEWPGHTDDPVVPYYPVWTEDYEEAIFINNEVWSPVLDVTQDQNGNPVPLHTAVTLLEFDVYRDLAASGSDRYMGYTYHTRSSPSGSGCDVRPWGGASVYAMSKTWSHVLADMSKFVVPGDDRAQVALGVYDWCWYVFPCNFGEAGCTHQGPFFDNVRLIRIDAKGPLWTADPLEMFQDDFPADGSLTGTVRMDTPAKLSGTTATAVPGDSAIVYAWEPVYGLRVETTTGTPAVYVHVRSSGGQAGPSVLGQYTTYLSDDGEWTTGVCQPVTTPTGKTAEKYRCDLNDNLFTPGDSVSFYFSATDAIGRTTFFSLTSGVVRSEIEARGKSDEAQCLPTGQSDILYVDDADPLGVQPFFDDAFKRVCLRVDRYDARARSADGSSGLSSSGLGGRASPRQIIDVYRTIVWNSGNFRYGTIHDGTSSKGNDVGLLLAYLDSTSAFDPGLYVSGNGVVEELSSRSGSNPQVAALLSRLGVKLLGGDHMVLGEPVSPAVVGNDLGIFDHRSPEFPAGELDVMQLSNPYCYSTSMRRFDVLDTLAAARRQMCYSDNPLRLATASCAENNLAGRVRRTVCEGFSFEHITNDGSQSLPDPAEHLRDVIEFIRGEGVPVTGIGDRVLFRNSLEQNRPNPFNPSTTIRYSIRARGRVTVAIYDVAGRLVRKLVDRVESPSAAGFAVVWDGTDRTGERVSSGVYFCRMRTEGFSDTKKLVFLK